MPSNSSSISLGLDDGDHPRRLVLLPNPTDPTSPHILAYGGDDGTICLIEKSETSADDNKFTVKSVRRFDDPIRAVASSKDGKRVAVGFDDGSTKIFVYDDSVQNSDNSDDKDYNKYHGFISNAMKNNTNEDDNDDILMSQSDGLSDDNTNEESFAGPRFDTTIRYLQFDPRSGGSNNYYYLAVASESGFCIVDVKSSDTLIKVGRLLQESCETEHNNDGIRSLSYYQNPEDDTCYLSTLGMDGKLCVWNLTLDMDDPQIEWDLLHKDKVKCITKSDIGEMNGSDAYDRSCKPVWSKNVSDSAAPGLLSLPGSTDIQLRSSRDVSNDMMIPSMNEEHGHIDTIVSTVFSPNNNYLVSGGRDGRIILWKLFKKSDEKLPGEFVCTISAGNDTNESIPTDMLWQKINGVETLLMSCSNGTLVTITGRDNILPPATESKKMKKQQNYSKEGVGEKSLEGEMSLSTDNNDKENDGNKEAKKTRKRLLKKASGNDDDDDDDDVFGHVDSASPTKKKAQSSSFIEDEAAEDDSEDDTIDKAQDDKDVATKAAKKDGDDDALDDKDVQDTAVDNGSTSDDFDDQRRGEFDDDFMPNDNDDDDHDHHRSSAVGIMSLPEPQPAFAPSSTPLNLPRRIMCWNHIGAITLRRNNEDISGNTRNTVDIEFTDVAARRPISFTDNMDFIIGSLGDDGAIFATDVKEDEDDDNDYGDDIVDGLDMSEKTKAAVKSSHRKRMKNNSNGSNNNSNGSSIYFHRFETFGSLREKDWYLTLPHGERALGCACGEGWAAVMTSRRFLRLYTSGGNQGAVFWLPGDPVTMVGRSRFLAVFYHEANPLQDGTQKLGFTLYDTDTSTVIKNGPVSSISAGSSLSWAGISKENSLVTTDSDGMLSMLVANYSGTDEASWEWAPHLDTISMRKSTDDSFWPISVQDGKFVCVPLKGGNEHPDAARRPVTTTLKLRLPFAQGALDQKANDLEELSIRANLSLNQQKFCNGLFATDETEEEIEDEYNAICGQVDKVALKLFMATLQAGKLERSLDLVHRLHTEKSFDIAIRFADQLNHRNLSDRIADIMDAKFPPPMSNDENNERLDESPFTSHHSEEFDTESSPPHHEDTIDSRRISPEFDETRRGKRTLHGETSDVDDGDDNQSSRRVKAKTRFETENDHDQGMKLPTKKKKLNPFAKKCLESPAKALISPSKKSPTKTPLSRASTFSKQSRELSKSAKRIL